MEDQENTARQHAHGCFFCDIAEPQIKAFIDHMWPANTREHFRNARIEMLKGWRTMLDAKIDHLSKQQAQRGTKVTVD
jgi:hypothetical protein